MQAEWSECRTRPVFSSFCHAGASNTHCASDSACPERSDNLTCLLLSIRARINSLDSKPHDPFLSALVLIDFSQWLGTISQWGLALAW